MLEEEQEGAEESAHGLDSREWLNTMSQDDSKEIVKSSRSQGIKGR